MELHMGELFVKSGEIPPNNAAFGKIENLWGIMKQFHLARIVMMSYWFGTNMRSVDESGDDVTKKVLPESIREYAPEMLKPLLDEWRELALYASSASLERLIRLCGDPASTQGQMKEAMEELQGRIVDEFNSQYFLSLPPRNIKDLRIGGRDGSTSSQSSEM